MISPPYLLLCVQCSYGNKFLTKVKPVFNQKGFWSQFAVLINVREIYSDKRNVSADFKDFIFYKCIYLFFQLRWVFVAVHGLSLVVARGGYSSLWCVGFSLQWLLLLWSTGLQAHGLQQSWLAGSRVQAQQFRCTGLVAPRHVGSSRTRARTRVPCLGRWILNHCATREVPHGI